MLILAKTKTDIKEEKFFDKSLCTNNSVNYVIVFKQNFKKRKIIAFIDSD